MEGLLDFIIDAFLNLPGPLLYFIILAVLLVCGLGLPVPEDITLAIGGMLAYYHKVSLVGIILVSMFGVLLGDSIIFFLGARYGRKLANRWPFKRFLSPERLEILKKRIHQQGSKMIFAARFMPGLRAPAYFTSGTVHFPFRKFLFFDFLASIISVPAIVYLVYRLGEELEHGIKMVRKFQNGLLGIILLLVLFFIIKAKYQSIYKWLRSQLSLK